MQEILFRGHQPTLKKWIYGFLYIDSFTKKCYILQPHTEKLYTGMLPNGLEVVNVGQYTGQKDKNGTKIFEGDICKWDNFYYKVGFEKNTSSWTFDIISKDTYIFPFFGSHCKKCEVVGNIYDNSVIAFYKE